MSRPIRVLIIDDSEVDPLLVVRRLQQSGFDPVWKRVQVAESLREALVEQNWDIAFCDQSMPGFGGRDALAIVQEERPDIPLVILSGAIREDDAVIAMQAGAVDYVGKDNLTRLIAVVERELRAAQERRARQAAEAAQRESQTQLRQFQKMESIEQLAAGVAHDFNNILAAIQGHTDRILGSMVEGKDAEESLKQVSAAAKRAASLTRQLLAFSRKQQMQAEDTNLNEAVSGITKMLARLLGADVALEFVPEPDLPTAYCDVAMMEQVLLNLSVNARDAMPGGGRLKIRTTARRIHEAEVQPGREARAGWFVCLSVTDTGCGIAPEILPRIFEPFFTTKEEGKGTGLGLATVYGIVKQHQGWIEVESEVGRGTTFHVFLPASFRAATWPGEPISSVAPRGGRETILIAEDESAVRRLAARILRSLGYEVLEAASGVEAIQVWEQHGKKVDLLLTDLVMPDGVTGRELAKSLETRESSLRVIYTSGHAPETRETSFVFRGGINFLQKPYEAHTLAKAVRDCLDKS